MSFFYNVIGKQFVFPLGESKFLFQNLCKLGIVGDQGFVLFFFFFNRWHSASLGCHVLANVVCGSLLSLVQSRNNSFKSISATSATSAM